MFNVWEIHNPIWRQVQTKRLDGRLAAYDHERAIYPLRHRILREVSDALDKLLEE